MIERRFALPQSDSVPGMDGRPIDAGSGILWRPADGSGTGTGASGPRSTDHGVIGRAARRQRGTLGRLCPTAACGESAGGENGEESEGLHAGCLLE